MKPETKNKIIGFFVLWALFTAVLWVCGGPGSGEKGDVYWAAWGAVQSQMISPSSAEPGIVRDYNNVVFEDGTNRWKVSHWCEANNVYGGRLKKNWSATVTKKGGEYVVTNVYIY